MPYEPSKLKLPAASPDATALSGFLGLSALFTALLITIPNTIEPVPTSVDAVPHVLSAVPCRPSQLYVNPRRTRADSSCVIDSVVWLDVSSLVLYIGNVLGRRHCHLKNPS
jgi:hypothetical protein